MVVCGVGGAPAVARLGARLRKLQGTPAQIAKLMRARDGSMPLDVAALMRDTP